MVVMCTAAVGGGWVLVSVHTAGAAFDDVEAAAFENPGGGVDGGFGVAFFLGGSESAGPAAARRFPPMCNAIVTGAGAPEHESRYRSLSNNGYGMRCYADVCVMNQTLSH